MYEESIKNPDIMMVILELYRVDALARIDGYYDHFPPKEKNVSIEEIETKNEGRGPAKVHVLVASKDFKAGEEIYKESPIISALDPSVQSAKTHCSQCMRKVQTDMTISPESDLLDSVYCSKKCQLDAKAQSQNFLFGLEPPVPLDIIPLPITADTQSARKEAQTSFVDYLKRTSKVGPLLVARLVATQIGYELAKAVNPQLASSFTGHPGSNSNSPYSINDHLERLRYLQMTVPDAESTLSRNLFKKTLLDFGEEHSTLRHIVIRGKIAYNAIGVCFPGDETTKATERPEDVERTRTPYGTSKQVGCGLYFVSSYLGHSCEPSVRPSFSHGTSELRLIANRRIEKGEQLTMSYVDVSQRPGESISAARTRRRYEIARGWRFACECPKCVREAGKKDESLSDLTASGSRVEHVTRHADQTSRAS
ncbi:hypothetical protein BD410DRAFT_779958 [Rickenella mellea]|uniref:SET domain-containing protein n=1 Tax=Rickenella mellea TaxID=50990 RepID=A0A4R5XFG9_9AGAM|nr:hypothetical protein BD410DRAFT_779958 [Rickenella mellea]